MLTEMVCVPVPLMVASPLPSTTSLLSLKPKVMLVALAFSLSVRVVVSKILPVAANTSFDCPLSSVNSCHSFIFLL